MAGNEQEGTPQQGGIKKIRLPAAETQPPELDGNMRSWGRGSTPAQSRRPASELEREAG